MPRKQGALNKPKTDDELINDLKARGYVVTKDGAPEPPKDGKVKPEPPIVKRDNLTVKKPAGAVTMNTCGLCGVKFAGKPANCPSCNVQFAGWRDE